MSHLRTRICDTGTPSRGPKGRFTDRWKGREALGRR